MRWVIITIIFVFDPLAVLLLIASQYTFEWRRQDGKNLRPMVESTPTIYGSDDGEKDDQPIQEEHVESDERNREASDKESLSGRSDVEPNEEQVPDSDEAQERTSTEQDTGGSATASEQVKEEIRDEIEELLEQADPEVLEEVAKELDIEKQVDNDLYDPYNDNRPDDELTEQQLAERQGRKLYSPDGRLAVMPKKVKSVKIKSIAEKAEENRKED